MHLPRLQPKRNPFERTHRTEGFFNSRKLEKGLQNKAMFPILDMDSMTVFQNREEPAKNGNKPI